MIDFIEELNEWMHKYLTHSNRFRNVTIAMAQTLVEKKKQEWEMLIDLGECMTATGEDIVELMEILKKYAGPTNA